MYIIILYNYKKMKRLYNLFTDYNHFAQKKKKLENTEIN